MSSSLLKQDLTGLGSCWACHIKVTFTKVIVMKYTFQWVVILLSHWSAKPAL